MECPFWSIMKVCLIVIQTPREPFISQLFKIIQDFVAYAEGRKELRRHKPCATLPKFVHGEHVRVRMTTEEIDTVLRPDDAAKKASKSQFVVNYCRLFFSRVSFSLRGHMSTWIRLNYPTSGTGGTSLGAD